MNVRPKRPPNTQTFAAMSIGDRLRYLREVKEMHQGQLAKRIGLTQAAISNLETDTSRKPSAPTLLKIARELDCNPQWILDGEGDPFNSKPVTSDSKVRLMWLFDQMDDNAKQALLAAAQAMVRT